MCGFIKNHIRTNINFLGMVSSSPLDPAFISPPIPDRVGQSRGIKLSYFACKRKLDKLGDKRTSLNELCKEKLLEHKSYIREYGIDMPDIKNFKWEDE